MLKFIKIYKSEKEYRADKEAYNYSLLADFEKMSLLGFRKKHILNEKEDSTSDMNIGTLGHMKLAEDEVAFENAIHLSTLVSKPKPQEVKFVDELFKLTLENLGTGDQFVGDFQVICKEAYDLAEIKSPKYENFISGFEGSVAEEYYRELRNAHGKLLVTQSDLELCDRCIDKAKKSPTVGDIINWKDRKNEVPILFEYEGIRFKALIDRLNFDHPNTKIMPRDWKFSYAIDHKEFEYNYFDLKYYIQQEIYTLAVTAFRDRFYPSYEIAPFGYVVINNKAFSDSVLHEFEFSNWENPWTGFTHKGRRYKSIPQIIEDMEWHKQNDIWSISKSTSLSGNYCKHIIGE